ncbi:MAG: zinc ribbon domain-containing protein [Candidatus Gracilibacteria bacterium]|nr:zinc ribbon domain-containing protein [Candidatus Gracilibacteria bacterium]
MIFKYIKNKYREVKFGYNVPDEDKNTIFERTDTKLGLFVNYTIIIFIFISIFIVFLSTIPGYNEKYLMYFFIADLIISSTFLIEYVYRWKYSSHKTNFPFRIMNIFDLLSFLPFFILIFVYGIGAYGIFAIFRIFRIFRIFELIERIPITRMFLIGINKHKIEIIIGFFIIFLLLTIFSTILYFIENTWGNSSSFDSLAKSAWWGIYALTTSGDAGMIPETFVGRMIAGILMSIGPMFISIISSVLIVIFLDSINMINLTKKVIICKKCFTENNENSHFCNNCGKKISS